MKNSDSRKYLKTYENIKAKRLAVSTQPAPITEDIARTASDVQKAARP
jgi:hypothetical protein